MMSAAAHLARLAAVGIVWTDPAGGESTPHHRGGRQHRGQRPSALGSFLTALSGIACPAHVWGRVVVLAVGRHAQMRKHVTLIDQHRHCHWTASFIDMAWHRDLGDRLRLGEVKPVASLCEPDHVGFFVVLAELTKALEAL